MKLRAATWNLQGRDLASVGLEAVLEHWSPDVLLLQEAQTGSLSGVPSLEAYPHRLLRSDAGYPPGLAILSRWPLTATGHVEQAGRRPPLIWAWTRAPETGLLLASFHAAAPIGDPRSDTPWHRWLQLRAIAAFANGIVDQGSPVVLGGDSNTIRYEMPGYTDTARGAGAVKRTWRPIGGVPWLPGIARLDRIFIGPGMEATSVETPCLLSRGDHCPVVATVLIAVERENAVDVT